MGQFCDTVAESIKTRETGPDEDVSKVEVYNTGSEDQAKVTVVDPEPWSETRWKEAGKIVRRVGNILEGEDEIDTEADSAVETMIERQIRKKVAKLKAIEEQSIAKQKQRDAQWLADQKLMERDLEMKAVEEQREAEREMEEVKRIEEGISRMVKKGKEEEEFRKQALNEKRKARRKKKKEMSLKPSTEAVAEENVKPPETVQTNESSVRKVFWKSRENGEATPKWRIKVYGAENISENPEDIGEGQYERKAKSKKKEVKRYGLNADNVRKETVKIFEMVEVDESSARQIIWKPRGKHEARLDRTTKGVWS